MHTASPATALEARITRNLPSLSPKLQQVAHYCLQHARQLHLCRIQEVAQRCETQPVTVVRLAKRYGFRGFLDFKMAFLAGTDAPPQDDKPDVGFSRSAHLLAQAHTVWIQASPAAALVAQCYADMLRVAGLCVRWRPLQPWQPGVGDVLMWVTLDGAREAGGMDAPDIPVVRVSDALGAGSDTHAHVHVPYLGQGLQGIQAGLALAQTVHNTRKTLLIQ